MTTNASPNAPLDEVSRERPDFLVMLGLMLPCSPQDVEEAFRAKAKQAHPDTGGSHELFLKLQEAYQRAKEFARFHSGRRVWLSEAIENYVVQEQIIAEVTRRGGQVEIEELSWLKQEIGEDFAQVLDMLVSIRLRGPAVGDEALEYLGDNAESLKHLRMLDLTDSSVTDTGLVRLSGLKQLRRLDLTNTGITNAGLAVVPYLELDWIRLHGTKVGRFAAYRLRRANRGLEVEL